MTQPDQEGRRAHEQPQALAPRATVASSGLVGMAIGAVGSSSMRRHSARRVADARVEERVGEVGEQRRDQEDDADDEHAASEEREVLLLRGR